MTKLPGPDPDEGPLNMVFTNVNDWLRFAEAKHGALIALNGAGTLGILSMLFGESHVSADVRCALGGLAVALVVSTIVSLLSFIARTPPAGGNLLYFRDIAEYPTDTEEYLNAVRNRYLETSGRDQLNRDIASQIVSNSKVTNRKYKLFNLGALITLLAMVSATIVVIYSSIR